MSLPDQPLIAALQRRNATGLHAQAVRLLTHAARLLPYSVSTFPGGTDHTLRHTTTVEQIGGLLLTDAILAALTDHELFFLAVACHYHDLAMAGSEADDRDEASREQVRSDHAIRVGDRLRDDWAGFGFDDARTAEVLADVCRGHRPRRNQDGVAEWNELHQIEVLGPGSSVRVRLVSALVYAFDELHLGADRAPARVQEWRQIANEESRRHWRRHQAVNGPARTPDGAILFQVAAPTPMFEENIRAQMLRKAFSALNDAGRQIHADGITAPLPAVRIQWERRETYNLLLPIAVGDMVPRTAAEISSHLIALHHVELPNPTEVAADAMDDSATHRSAAAERGDADAIRYGHLVKAEGGFVLATDARTADEMFGRMRDADEIDLLFAGRHRLRWEDRLFASQYGRAYVREEVLPAIGRAYSVRLAERPPTDPLRVLIERCPSAARLVTDYQPPPGNLVKEGLLRHAVITAALYDLHADPNRILDTELRRAVRDVVGTDPAVGPMIRLAEELALIGAYTPDQLYGPGNPLLSDDPEEDVDEPSGVRVVLQQSAAARTPITDQLPGLLLASHRAGTTLLLATAPDQPLAVTVHADGSPGLPSGPVQEIGIGPGTPQFNGPIRLYGRLEVSRRSRIVRLILTLPSSDPSFEPFLFGLPAPHPSGRGQTGGFGLAQRPHFMTVGDVRAMDAAARLIRSGDCRLEARLGTERALLVTLTLTEPNNWMADEPYLSEAVRGLRGLDSDQPLPLLLPPGEMEEIGRLTDDERAARWRAIREGLTDRRTLCPLYTRICNSEGVPLEEEFLRSYYRPLLEAPQVAPGGPIPQTDIDRQYAAGETDFHLRYSFHERPRQLAAQLRDWANGTTPDFPFQFQFGKDSIRSPTIGTVLRFTTARRVDRTWHWLRPMVFDFRPANRAEVYEHEAEYWQRNGQPDRAALALEIRDRLQAAVAE